MTHKTIIASELLSEVIVKGLKERKAEDILRMDLRNVDGAITDFFVIATGTSDRHVKALADSAEEFARLELQDKPISREGLQLGEWVLLDYSNVVVHIFLDEKRKFYDIEGLWGDAEFVKEEG